MAKLLRSRDLFERASKIIPGGVNSPVRMFKPHPFFTEKAQGSQLHDVDGNRYIDYCMAYGALIFGHSYRPILDAVKKQLEDGTVYGTPIEAEVELAEIITDSLPCAEMVRLANSGAEATMHAIRLARGYTGRPKLVKFDGCYHGAHDSVLVKAGSAAAISVPTSLGIPQETAKNTIVLPFNNVDALHQTFEDQGDEIAAVIVEPVIGNMGVIPPSEGYLTELRRTSNKHGSLLIFDEVITGYRLALGGAQEYYGVKPDIASLGKVLGGGFPISAVAGNKKIMENFSPTGGVYEAGTFSGNPVSVTAAIKVLTELRDHGSRIYGKLQEYTDELAENLSDFIASRKIEAQVNHVASMFTVFFTSEPVVNSEKALSSDRSKYSKFHQGLMMHGVYFPPSQFETCFVTTAHTEDDMHHTLDAAFSAMKEL
ncbi:glutamate-1-semialdehyde 2,1-aminomutase [Candidatus Bathyarchaeota archaeon]|nr:glutamate-1-semialdehyde 2,1-aminomutase [Candidatus Bathyarchaeota archaeon]